MSQRRATTKRQGRYAYACLSPQARGEGESTMHQRLADATPCLTGADRLRIFNALPPWAQQFASLEQEQQIREARS